MNYKKILLLISALTLVGCNYSQGIAAKPPKIIASSLPAQPNANTLATPLTYKIESYDSKVMPGKRTYSVSLPLIHQKINTIINHPGSRFKFRHRLM